MERKILVVDDNADIVDLLKNRLEFNHYKVSTALVSKEALVQARETLPDLILIDVS